jgi:serine/threonine protein kinase
MSSRANSYIGREFGHYQIKSVVACGSFGSVYLAQDLHLQRAVAIKIWDEAHTISAENREQFLQEARLLEKLKHPHIVPIYDLGIDDGLPYLVTEYAPSGSLQDLLKRRSPIPLQVKEAIDILAQIGNALYHAHQQSIIHRDLKPAVRKTINWFMRTSADPKCGTLSS